MDDLTRSSVPFPYTY